MRGRLGVEVQRCGEEIGTFELLFGVGVVLVLVGVVF